MITEHDVEEALDYLRDSAQEYSQYRAAEKLYENKLKRIEALKFMEQEQGAVEAKRMAARASEDYGQCLDDYREAKENAEYLDAKREACKLRISYYQTQVKAKMGHY